MYFYYSKVTIWNELRCQEKGHYLPGECGTAHHSVMAQKGEILDR